MKWNEFGIIIISNVCLRYLSLWESESMFAHTSVCLCDCVCACFHLYVSVLTRFYEYYIVRMYDGFLH